MSKRGAFLKRLPSNGIVAEIGVYEGAHATKIIEYSKPEKLYLIDPWCDHNTPYINSLENYSKDGKYEERYAKVQDMFKDSENVELIKKFSMNAVTMFPDEFFDWIYVDADHTYPKIKEDLNAWYPKIKEKGYICGHDYSERKINIFGVKKAVDEFIKDRNLKINLRIKTEWAIRKIII